jgi:hypothetical protein
LLIFGIALLVTSGCMSLKQAEPPKPPPKPEPWRSELPASASDVDALIHYTASVRRLVAAELTREHDSVKQAVAKNQSDVNRLRLAIIYSLPGTPLHDDAKCLAILDAVIKEASATPVRNFASFLQTMVTDNKRLDDNGQTLAQKLKEEQKQNEQLQQKLEALKSIEKSLSDRDRQQPQQAPPPQTQQQQAPPPQPVPPPASPPPKK